MFASHWAPKHAHKTRRTVEPVERRFRHGVDTPLGGGLDIAPFRRLRDLLEFRIERHDQRGLAGDDLFERDFLHAHMSGLRAMIDAVAAGEAERLHVEGGIAFGCEPVGAFGVKQFYAIFSRHAGYRFFDSLQRRDDISFQRVGAGAAVEQVAEKIQRGRVIFDLAHVQVDHRQPGLRPAFLRRGMAAQRVGPGDDHIRMQRHDFFRVGGAVLARRAARRRQIGETRREKRFLLVGERHVDGAEQIGRDDIHQHGQRIGRRKDFCDLVGNLDRVAGHVGNFARLRRRGQRQQNDGDASKRLHQAVTRLGASAGRMILAKSVRVCRFFAASSEAGFSSRERGAARRLDFLNLRDHLVIGTDQRARDHPFGVEGRSLALRHENAPHALGKTRDKRLRFGKRLFACGRGEIESRQRQTRIDARRGGAKSLDNVDHLLQGERRAAHQADAPFRGVLDGVGRGGGDPQRHGLLQRLGREPHANRT